MPLVDVAIDDSGAACAETIPLLTGSDGVGDADLTAPERSAARGTGFLVDWWVGIVSFAAETLPFEEDEDEEAA
jgi:hypothetical protein